MRKQRRSTPAQGITRWLHPLLVVSTLLYLYSPFLDHWFGFDAQTRQHTHISISMPLAFSADLHVGHDHANHEHLNDEDATASDDFHLCTLDLDASFSLLFGAFLLPEIAAPVTETPTIAGAAPYQAVATIFSAIATPPPNLL